MSNDRDEWFERAACAGVAVERGDCDLFFGTDEPGTQAALREGKALCAVCPTTRECLEYAADTDIEHGIYGGLDENQRKRFRNKHPNIRSYRARTEHEHLLTVLRNNVARTKRKTA